MRTPTTCAALALALTPLAALAEDPFALDEIVVSGGLGAFPADGYGRSWTVVTGTELEDRGIATVQDALRGLPGVAVNSNGSSFTQVRIRGGEANHTLILIDGVPAGGGDGDYVLTGLEAEGIEKIEVLRGPQSVYFGSNASSGVINIITRKAEPGFHYGGAVEGGNGFGVSGYVSQRGDRGGLRLSWSNRDDKGYDQSGDGGEKDGIRRQTLVLSGDWAASDALSFGFGLRHSYEEYDYDSTSYSAMDAAGYVVDDPAPYSHRIETLGSVWMDYAALDGRLTHHLAFEKSVYRQSYMGASYTRSQTEALKYRASFSLDGAPVVQANQILSLLAERHEDSSTAAEDYKRRNTSLALEYRGFYDFGLDVQAGVRRDMNSVFEDATTWNVGLSYRIPATGLRLHASAGAGIVNPSYYELFADDAYTLGNPDLRPEKNRSFDIGIEAETADGRGRLDVTWFRERLEDEITYVYGAASDGSGRASYANESGTSKRRGVELAGRWQASERLDLRLSYTWLDAKNPDGSVELRRPQRQLGLGATLKTFAGRGTVSADLRYVSGNFDAEYFGAYETKALPDYTLVDIAATYDATESVQLFGRVSNLFDRSYADTWGYPGAGRTTWVGVRANF